MSFSVANYESSLNIHIPKELRHLFLEKGTQVTIDEKFIRISRVEEKIRIFKYMHDYQLFSSRHVVRSAMPTFAKVEVPHTITTTEVLINRADIVIAPVKTQSGSNKIRPARKVPNRPKLSSHRSPRLKLPTEKTMFAKISIETSISDAVRRLNNLIVEAKAFQLHVNDNRVEVYKRII
jgi:hypothetical protein